MACLVCNERLRRYCPTGQKLAADVQARFDAMVELASERPGESSGFREENYAAAVRDFHEHVGVPGR